MSDEKTPKSSRAVVLGYKHPKAQCRVLADACRGAGLSANALAVVRAIWARTDETDAYAFPSQATLARETLLGESTARREVKRLAASGILAKAVRTRNGVRCTLEYALDWDRLAALAKVGAAMTTAPLERSSEVPTAPMERSPALAGSGDHRSIGAGKIPVRKDPSREEPTHSALARAGGVSLRSRETEPESLRSGSPGPEPRAAGDGGELPTRQRRSAPGPSERGNTLRHAPLDAATLDRLGVLVGAAEHAADGRFAFGSPAHWAPSLQHAIAGFALAHFDDVETWAAMGREAAAGRVFPVSYSSSPATVAWLASEKCGRAVLASVASERAQKLARSAAWRAAHPATGNARRFTLDDAMPPRTPAAKLAPRPAVAALAADTSRTAPGVRDDSLRQRVRSTAQPTNDDAAIDAAEGK